MSDAPIVSPAYDFKRLSDIKQGPMRVLLFGAPKVGKSELLLTFPNVAVVDYDGEGVKVANNAGFIRRHGNREDTVRFASFEDEFDPNTGIFKEAKAFKESQKWINQVINDPWAKTLGVDSATSLSVAAMHAGIVASQKRGRSKTMEHAKADGLILMGQQDFGAEMGAMGQLFDQLMAVRGIHIVVTAHVRDEKTDTGMTTSREPLLTGGRLRGQVGKWFDEVWFLDSKPDGTRVLITGPKGTLKGLGSRLGLPLEIENPSYEKITSLINKG
jgi:hypothetical protein